MFRRNDVQWNHNTVYSDLLTDTTKVTIQEEDFLAIMVYLQATDNVYDGDDLRDVMSISFEQASGYTTELNHQKFNYHDLPFSKCSEYDFKYFNKGNLGLGLFNDYLYCFNLTKSIVAGVNGNKDILETLSISIDT